MDKFIELVLLMDSTAEEAVEGRSEGPIGAIWVEIVGVGPLEFDVSLYKKADGPDYSLIFETEAGGGPIEVVMSPRDYIRDMVSLWLEAGRESGVVA